MHLFVRPFVTRRYCVKTDTFLTQWGSFLLPTGLPGDNGTGPDLSRSSFYF